MENLSHGSRSGDYLRRFPRIIVGLAALLLLPGRAAIAQTDEAAKIPDVQLDSLVAPIALYPDPLLSQVLVASTYPLEITQLQQFLQNNPHLKDKALGDGVELKPWDPSIKAMAIFPDIVKRLSDDIRWTTDLGNAFLAQESDVLDAIQRMRARAQEKGTLQTVEQQIVGTETLEDGQQVITIEPADPETVYVPILRSDAGLWRTTLSLSAYCISAAGLLLWQSAGLRSWGCFGTSVEWRLGLRLRLAQP